MQLNFVEISLIVLFFLLLTLPPFLLFQKSSRSISNKLLAAFLLSKAICISNFLAFSKYEVFYEEFPHLFIVGSSFTILWGPLLYFYVKSLVSDNFKINFWFYIHFVPFLVHLIYFSLTFHLNSAETKRIILDQGGPITGESALILNSIIQLSILIYTLAGIVEYIKYRKSLKNFVSSLEKINLTWLGIILFGFLLKWFFDFMLYLARWEVTDSTGSIEIILSRVILFVFINILIFQSLRYPIIFSGKKIYKLEKVPSLSNALATEYYKKLVNFMDAEKPFLEPELTLIQLSDKVNIPQRSLSEVINNRVGQNFYDFINGYRVEESKKMLRDPQNDNKTILEIIYSTGFKSKSSFQTYFKKITGITPTQFRKMRSAKAS